MRILHVGFGFYPYRSGGLIAYAEDLMRAQVQDGHQVTYFFNGRNYPLFPRDRLHAWRRDGIAMREILNSTLNFGGDSGTRTPEADLSHPPSEAAFQHVLERQRPDVVHIQELIGLPSSLIDIARGEGIPTLMTLQDYLPLCPTLKLFDVDNQLCERRDVGAQCARCSAAAPATPLHQQLATAGFEMRERVPERLQSVAFGIGMPVRHRLLGRRHSKDAVSATPAELAPPPDATDGALRYQARRDINVERLGRLSLAVAQSGRLAEIYGNLGVDPERIRVMQFTLRHLAGLTPKVIAPPTGPVKFVTLNGCASVQKGAEVVLGALELMREWGLESRFTMSVYGYIPDDVRDRLLEFPNASNGGFYATNGLDSLLEPFDVGLVPSIWEEAYGYVGIEFLAKGIPVIGNARGGIVEYTRDGETGWVNRGADAAGLAAIMAEIVRSPESIAALNASIRERRDEIVKPLGDHVREMEALYAEIVDESAQRARRLRQVPRRAGAPVLGP